MFLQMLPSIRAQARFAFRHLKPEAKAEAVEEVIANAFVAFSRLVQLGKADLAYPTPLAQYAIKQVRSGRRVGSKLCVNDVLSPYAQQRKRFDVARLDRQKDGEWIEAIIPDDSRPVADQAAFRVDFPEWLDTLASRKRRIAKALSSGHRTKDVSRRFRLSPGRISQLRIELRLSWEEYQGESDA